MNALVSCPSICVYTRVDPISLCPNHSLRTVTGVPWMRQFIAKLCLNVCGCALLSSSPAVSHAFRT